VREGGRRWWVWWSMIFLDMTTAVIVAGKTGIEIIDKK